jgi:hypothetical protein
VGYALWGRAAGLIVVGSSSSISSGNGSSGRAAGQLGILGSRWALGELCGYGSSWLVDGSKQAQEKQCEGRSYASSMRFSTAGSK